jgi:hypothetical protein
VDTIAACLVVLLLFGGIIQHFASSWDLEFVRDLRSK